jgi:hypothetical protein
VKLQGAPTTSPTQPAGKQFVAEVPTFVTTAVPPTPIGETSKK